MSEVNGYDLDVPPLPHRSPKLPSKLPVMPISVENTPPMSKPKGPKKIMRENALNELLDNSDVKSINESITSAM